MVCTVMLAMMNFGYAQVSWNVLQLPFKLRYQQRGEWLEEGEVTKWAVLLTTSQNVGAMISALSGSFFMRFGKWTMILVCNMIMIIGSAITLYDNIWVILAGKFIVGLAIGGFTVYCPNFIYEIVPGELKSQVGGICNFIVTFGIFLPALFGLAIPDAKDLDKDDKSFAVHHYWRVVWAFPILVALIQSILLLTVFKFDTVVELKKAGKIDGPGGLNDVLSKFYTSDAEVKKRNEAIVVHTQD
jgi:MFS family permease